jgi:hypothetical protein
MALFTSNNATGDASRIDWASVSDLLEGRFLDEPRRIPVCPHVSNPGGLSRLELLKEMILWGRVPLILLYRLLDNIRLTGYTLGEGAAISDPDFSSFSGLFYDVFSAIPRIDGKLNFEITPGENFFFRYSPYSIHISAPFILRHGTHPQYPPRFRDAILAGALYHELFHSLGLIRVSPIDERINLLRKEQTALYYVIREEVAAYAFSRAVEDVFCGLPPFSSERLIDFHDDSPEHYYHVIFASPQAYPKSLHKRIQIARRSYRMLVPVYYRIIAETLNLDASGNLNGFPRRVFQEKLVHLNVGER